MRLNCAAKVRARGHSVTLWFIPRAWLHCPTLLLRPSASIAIVVAIGAVTAVAIVALIEGAVAAIAAVVLVVAAVTGVPAVRGVLPDRRFESSALNQARTL